MHTTALQHQPPEAVSPEVQELISYHPHWIIRKGNTAFFLIVFVLLALTWLVKYPDIAKGTVKLVATNAPSLLVARTEGKLQKLLVTNEQQVIQGQPLAFLQSTASYEQVLSLQSWIKQVEPFIIKDSLEILLIKPVPLFNELGELQTPYQDFQTTLQETMHILSHGYYKQKKRALQEDMSYLTAIQANARQQQALLQQDYTLQQNEYKVNELLAKDRVIAPLELNQQKSKVIGKEQSLEQMSAQLINNEISVHNKSKELLDLQKYITDQQQKFRAALLGMKSKIQDWLRQYAITATEDGKVLFVSFLQENELIVNGQELFYIQPASSRYYGQLTVSQNGLGKIKTGQKVLIRVASYPSNEFGYLKGIVNYIPAIPGVKDSFLIKVDLPEGLRTNYNKTILFRNNLLAQGEIITDDRRLLNRFAGQLSDILRR